MVGVTARVGDAQHTKMGGDQSNRTRNLKTDELLKSFAVVSVHILFAVLFSPVTLSPQNCLNANCFLPKNFLSPSRLLLHARPNRDFDNLSVLWRLW